MVKICSFHYPKSNEEDYQHYYEPYPYPLHDFQKWCVEGVVTGNHVLSTAPTGSGKTFGGEFAIQHMHAKGKKVIYTTPIKALSNEKFHAFTHKYPHIRIGILTGDLKCDPDADVLIMTTEILLNKLYQIKSTTPSVQSSVSFDMDLETELGCVVFDEIHMINDEHRGHVWEQSIMLLPPHIQMIGLSATLDDPEKFAYWLETKGDPSIPHEKEVYLTRKQVRAVPLIHYSFITATSAIHKHIKDKATQEDIKKQLDKPILLQDAKNTFHEANYQNNMRVLQLFEKHDIRVKRQHVLNKVADYLVEQEMLPALCYVFSRKQLEKCAAELTTNLLEFDSKIPYTVDRECEQIIRTKLANYQEYIQLPEYLHTVSLLRKGIGMHHAGLMPVLREMVELLFARGFVKVLFCTETMSVGINLPVKTTIFTDIHKYNGEIIRPLYSHEYTQAAGRAGRLGLDTVGHVIHLNNLFRPIDPVSYKQMMNGKPQTLLSKFKISYNLILNLLDIGDHHLVPFAKKSMITCDLDKQMGELYSKMNNLQTEVDHLHSIVEKLRTPLDILRESIDLRKKVNHCVNKKRKEIERKLSQLMEQHKHITQDTHTYLKLSDKETELNTLQDQYDRLQHYFQSGVQRVLDLLQEEGFLQPNGTELTLTGKIASQIKELHCLIFATLYHNHQFDTFTSKQLAMLFSCFTHIRVNDDLQDHVPNSSDPSLNKFIQHIKTLYTTYSNKELSKQIQTGFDYDMHYDLLHYVESWCNCETVEECKQVLQSMTHEKNIFLGEFIKSILKINNIAAEFEKIAEMTGNVAFLHKLQEIPTMTLKYVVTNQSLYV